MLYKCPTCECEVSENAHACPKCGEPDVGAKAKVHYHDYTLPKEKKAHEEWVKWKAENERDSEEFRKKKAEDKTRRDPLRFMALIACPIIVYILTPANLGKSPFDALLFSIIIGGLLAFLVAEWMAKRDF